MNGIVIWILRCMSVSNLHDPNVYYMNHDFDQESITIQPGTTMNEKQRF